MSNDEFKRSKEDRGKKYYSSIMKNHRTSKLHVNLYENDKVKGYLKNPR